MTVSTVTLEPTAIHLLDDVQGRIKEGSEGAQGTGGEGGGVGVGGGDGGGGGGGGAVLSDGSGFVSKEVMKEVARRLGMVDQATPSAIQARFGGAKGVWLRCDDPSEWPCLRSLRSKLTAGARNDDKSVSRELF